MNIKFGIVAVGFSLAAGCMSLEERLASSDANVRKAAEVEMISELHQRVATDAERIAAVNRVTDQELLIHIAGMAGKYPSMDITCEGVAAVSKIQDNEALWRIFGKAKSFEVKKAAVEKLTNESWLTEIAGWNGGDQEKETLSVIACERIQDQKNLEKIAFKTLSCKVKKAVTSKLTDEIALTKIAVGNNQMTDDEICLIACRKIKDPKRLKKVVVSAVFESVAKVAYEKIDDSRVKAEAAIESKRGNLIEQQILAGNMRAEMLAALKNVESLSDAFVEKCNDEAVLRALLQCSCLTKDQRKVVSGKLLASAKKNADSGDAEAQYLYALELSNAHNDIGAYKYFKSAADRGYGLAFRGVGLGYECGFAGVTNKDEAAKWYKRFVDWAQGKEGEKSAKGQFLLGLSYKEGRGVTESSIGAFGAYKRAAELGYQVAKVEVARCYLNGYGVKKDEVEAAILMEPLAESGIAEAQRLLGFMYQNGLGVHKDIDKAISWFEKAAAQGGVRAVYDCGIAWLKKVDSGYHYGIAPFGERSIGDMPDDLSAKPEEWFLKAASEDYVPAWWALGFLYEDHFKRKRRDEGLQWMVKAAQKGHVDAIESLAIGYGHERYEHDDENVLYQRTYWGLKYLAIDAALTDSRWVKWVNDDVKRLDKNMKGRKLLRKVRAQIVAEGGVDVTSEEYQNAQKSKLAERVKGLLAKSETAAQGKFCLKGFYVGMPIADAKDLISCYLPESAIQIGQDKTLAEGKVGQCIGIDAELSGERAKIPMYFCQADENGVVYRFNFPKKLLSQFFKYGTSSYGNWVKCFAYEHKISLRGTTVSDKWEMEGVSGWQSQDVYEWQDLKTGTRVAYFGKFEEETSENIDEVLRSKTPYQIGKIAGFGNIWNGRWLNSKGAEEGTLRVEQIRE